MCINHYFYFFSWAKFDYLACLKKDALKKMCCKEVVSDKISNEYIFHFISGLGTALCAAAQRLPAMQMVGHEDPNDVYTN